MVEATQLLYLHDTYQYTAQANVIDLRKEDEHRYALILDRTILYPQGGGQPYDMGRIHNEHGEFVVEEVWLRDGVVHHIGFIQHGSVRGSVTVEVDANRRIKHAQLHTCGHLIDYALHDIGITQWQPVKGYHFPEGAYVMYRPHADVDLASYPDMTNKLEQAINTRIASGGSVHAKFVSRDELSQYVSYIPDYIPSDKPCRIVVYDGAGVPCGGTHVKDVREIGCAYIRKIAKKKGDIKIAYDVE